VKVSTVTNLLKILGQQRMPGCHSHTQRATGQKRFQCMLGMSTWPWFFDAHVKGPARQITVKSPYSRCWLVAWLVGAMASWTCSLGQAGCGMAFLSTVNGVMPLLRYARGNVLIDTLPVVLHAALQVSLLRSPCATGMLATPCPPKQRAWLLRTNGWSRPAFYACR